MRLQERGAARKDALVLSEMVFDPETRCSICGVPVRMLDFYHRKGWPTPATNRKFWRMEVDRIEAAGPYTIENCRPLCRGCNTHRGHEARTDTQVLVRMTRKWEEALSPRYLWWLRGEDENEVSGGD